MFIHILVIILGTFSVAAWSTYPWKEEARGNPERPAGATKSSETINCLRLIIVYTLVLINNSKAFKSFLRWHEGQTQFNMLKNVYIYTIQLFK